MGTPYAPDSDTPADLDLIHHDRPDATLLSAEGAPMLRRTSAAGLITASACSGPTCTHVIPRFRAMFASSRERHPSQVSRACWISVGPAAAPAAVGPAT